MRLKYVFIALTIICVNVGTAHAQLAQKEFETASLEMNEGRYVPAMLRLQQIEQAGYVSGPLYLNLAIGYTALDSLGKAKFYYMKAVQYDETADAARKGLSFVEGRFRYRSPKLPELPWDVFFNVLRDTIGLRWLLIGTVLLLNMSGIWGALLLFRPALKPAARWGIPVLLAASAFLGVSAWRIDYATHRYAEAIQIISETKVMDKPASDALPVANSHEGYTFVVDYEASRAVDGWYYVRMSNGVYGWVESAALKVF